MRSYLVNNVRNSLALVGLGAVACGSVDAGSFPARAISTTTEPIIGGEDSPSTDNAIVQIARFVNGELTKGVGTGVLMAPNLVLTARHNVSKTEQSEDLVDCRPAETEALFGSTFPLDDLRVFVGPENRAVTRNTEEGAHAIKEIRVEPTNKRCDTDLAFLILEQPINDVEPVPLRLSGPPSVTEAVSVVGFGFRSVASDPAKVRQRLEGLKITGYTPWDGLQTDQGEGPGRILINVTDRGPCVGDSGGPVLSTRGAAIAVMQGYFTTGGPINPLEPYADCLETTWIGVTLYDRKSFVLEAFDSAGYTHIEEEQGVDAGSGAQLGASCDESSDCASKLCVEIGEDGVCTNECTGGSCPDGFSCSPAGDTMYCLRQKETFRRDSGCSVMQSNSAGKGAYCTVVLLVGLACMRRRRR